MSIWLWIGFLTLVATILIVDLGVLHRRSRQISPGRALLNTGVFVLMALAFTPVIYIIYERGWMGQGLQSFNGQPMTGYAAAAEYLSTWLLEYTLSVDNLFIFTLVFAHFQIPVQHQHRVLFWGILGALLLRGVMIGAGSALVAAFFWVLYLFGAVLIYTAIKMLLADDSKFDPSRSITLRIARKLFPITSELHGERFLVHQVVNHKRVLAATPLLLVLLVVEATDVVFAVDSIPAAFGQTRQAYIIFTSNVFAVMGLRSLYFALAGLMGMFKYLKVSLSLILVYIGVKMLLEHPIQTIPLSRIYKLGSWLGLPDIAVGYGGLDIPAATSLGVIAATLATGVLASVLSRREQAKSADEGSTPGP